MKRRDLMRKLTAKAKADREHLITSEGGSHTKVQIGDRSTVVPRHNEINEITAREILKQMGADQ